MDWITEKIDPIENNRDVEYIADVLSELLYEKHGRRVQAMAFEIEVTFQFDEDAPE
jgi:hypothetical protein